jgi:integrase
MPLRQRNGGTAFSFKRQLKPILAKLGIGGGMHAFRHGNATVLDGLNAPMMVRQERLGHTDPRTTMGYTHLISSDDRSVAAKLGGFLAQVLLKNKNGSGTANAQTV